MRHEWMGAMVSAAFLVSLAAQAAPEAETSRSDSNAQIVVASRATLAPLPGSVDATSSHAPFVMGDCTVCHSSASAHSVGALKAPGPKLCLGCHEQAREIKGHGPATRTCTGCHNPHNAVSKMLLRL